MLNPVQKTAMMRPRPCHHCRREVPARGTSKFGTAPKKHSRTRFPRLPNTVVPSAKVFVGADDKSFELETLTSVRAGTSPESDCNLRVSSAPRKHSRVRFLMLILNVVSVKVFTCTDENFELSEAMAPAVVAGTSPEVPPPGPHHHHLSDYAL